MTDRVDRGLLLLNAAGALVAAGYAAAGLWRSPGPRGRAALGASPQGERFWAAQSAVRTWAVAVPLLVGCARSRPDPAVLVVAALVQLGDAAVGAWSRKPGMAVTPTLMGVAHVLTARRQTSAPARKRGVT